MGFLVKEAADMQECELKMPAFMKGKQQLDPVDVEPSQLLASPQIPDERVVSATEFSIFQSTLPMTYYQMKRI